MRFIASAAYVALAMLMSVSAGRTHDIYSHLKDNRGVPCCNDTDCRPARFRITARGVEMLVKDRWLTIPRDVLQYRTLPGDTGQTAGGHWCGYDDWDFADAVNPDLLGVTRCAILPPGFVLAR